MKTTTDEVVISNDEDSILWSSNDEIEWLDSNNDEYDLSCSIGDIMEDRRKKNDLLMRLTDIADLCDYPKSVDGDIIVEIRHGWTVAHTGTDYAVRYDPSGFAGTLYDLAEVLRDSIFLQNDEYDISVTAEPDGDLCIKYLAHPEKDKKGNIVQDAEGFISYDEGAITQVFRLKQYYASPLDSYFLTHNSFPWSKYKICQFIEKRIARMGENKFIEKYLDRCGEEALNAYYNNSPAVEEDELN